MEPIESGDVSIANDSFERWIFYFLLFFLANELNGITSSTDSLFSQLSLAQQRACRSGVELQRDSVCACAASLRRWRDSAVILWERLDCTVLSPCVVESLARSAVTHNWFFFFFSSSLYYFIHSFGLPAKFLLRFENYSLTLLTSAATNCLFYVTTFHCALL